MKPEELRSRFGGVVAFPVTPFKQDLSLDVEGLRKNLQHTAKFPVLRRGGRRRHRRAVFAGRRRAPQGGGGDGGGLRRARRRSSPASAAACPSPWPWPGGAAEAGADGILALPPYYPERVPTTASSSTTRRSAHATPLGLLVYGRDWFNPGPELVARLAAAIPTLIAWKDGQGDLRRYQMIRQRVGDRLYWIGGAGDDMVPGYYAMGIRTYTSSIATVAPGAVHGAGQGRRRPGTRRRCAS